MLDHFWHDVTKPGRSAMEIVQKHPILGPSSLVILLASWLALGLGGRLVPQQTVPHLWLAVLIIGLPASLVLGVVAGRSGSRWWFAVSGLVLLSEAFFLISVAV
jgi:hypothetical protein